MKKRVKEFILKSKKVYPVLIAGIVICTCVLTANISYDLGKAQSSNAEYLNDYSVLVGAYVNAFGENEKDFESTLNEAIEYAHRECDIMYDFE